jgi:hypothetical protein
MNPFTERGRITDPHCFIGRWRELSVIFDRLVLGRPVLVTGMPGIGRSSLLTHIAQSAAVNLERPELAAYYIDLAVLPDAAACYHLMIRALGSTGDNQAALEVALLRVKNPVIFCLDNAESAIAEGWGGSLLENLARVARRSLAMRPASIPLPNPETGTQSTQGAAMAGAEPMFLLVTTVRGGAPTLSEPFATVGMGAFSPSEVRLLADAYLQNTGIQFSRAELRELTALSVGHPAYLQRAAYHLFQAHLRPDYDWRAAYLSEAQERPQPGAPLPPAIFEGEDIDVILATYTYEDSFSASKRLPERVEIGGMGDLAAVVVLLIAALLAWQISANWLAGAGVLLVGAALLLLLHKARAASIESQENTEEHAE